MCLPNKLHKAIEKSYQFKEYNISWFEEPVTSDNLEELNFIREHVQPEVNIAAGEYGYNLPYFNQMLKANSVDILMQHVVAALSIL